MKSTDLLIALTALVAFGCGGNQQATTNQQHVDTRIISGYVVPEDSAKAPGVVSLDASKTSGTPCLPPEIHSTHTHIHTATAPEIKSGNQVRQVETGEAFSTPELIVLKKRTVPAGQPEVIIAKDAYTKDQNPQNFSIFNKLQGLKHGNIRCLMEDADGNIWLGTEGGGVSRYDGKSFTHYTMHEGLPNNDVRCMHQDLSGNIWFGTNGGGVCRYDGKVFDLYAKEEGFPANDILCIAEETNGTLWFGTNGGGAVKLFKSSDTDSIARCKIYTTFSGLPSDTVWSALCDQNGHIWLGTARGLCKQSSTSFAYFTKEEGLPDNEIITLYEDRSGTLWIGTENGGISNLKWDYMEAGSTYEFKNYSTAQGLSNNTVRSILQDRFGHLWFGTIGGGASQFIPAADAGNEHGTFIHFGAQQGLTNAAIASILEDQSGNIWFATYGGGIAKYDGLLFTHFTTQEGLPGNGIWSMLEDSNGNLWLGAGSGGLSKYDGSSFSNYTTAQGLSNNDVRSMLEDSHGTIWFGTFGGGLSRFTPSSEDGHSGTFLHLSKENGLSGNDIRSMVEDSKGRIWIATSDGGVTCFDGESFLHFGKDQGLSTNDVRCLLMDHLGQIWIATSGGGVNLIQESTTADSSTFKITQFTKKEGFADDYVLCMLQDHDKNIWFGTYGNGAVKMVPDKNQPNHYTLFNITEKEGLSNNFVFSLLEDFDGNIWFGTRFGLSKLSPEKHLSLIEKMEKGTRTDSDIFFKNYTYEDGFLGIGCNGKAICQTKDGTIWFGTNDRLTAYHPPAKTNRPDTLAPNIQLTGVSLFNENISWIDFESQKDTSFELGNGVRVGDFEFDGITKWYGLPENLSLAHNNNFLTFNFIGITMNQPKRVRYQYKLEGIDENWSAITNRTEAPYGNLPHGNYIFKVKAMNSDGIWSEEYHYAFSIRPPYWKTWWFRTLVAAIILLLLFAFYRWRTASLRSRQRQLEKTVLERTTEVVEQKQLIEEKHKEITDSINYAERIQRSFLASQELLSENLKDYFVLFKPKDVVSGDFYWAAKLHNGTFALVTADSTGHGVPGAIMSILNITCLEKAVDELKLVEPDKILNQTRLSIIDRLKRDGSAEGGKDGMDASLLCFDLQSKSCTYAAANNPVWIVRKNAIIVCEPDNMPVAKHDKQTIPFTARTIQLESGDQVYTLTDGYPDQFGGPKGKKFMYKKLKELLLAINSEPMAVQRDKLNAAFMQWKGNLEQVDDVCIIGVRIA